MKDNIYSYLYYGSKTNTEEVVKLIQHVLHTNDHAVAIGKKKKSVCIWGRHGIGKTELVEKIAKEKGYHFAYIAPAQFEEMGDLLGMPTISDDKTAFAPPAWVPTVDEPGILLIDDVNRADDRILRGIMQLLQNYELTSWKLPPKWTIVLTANPDGGDYSVTPMDDAMITRMLHVTMEFDVKAWARWAEKNGIDQRGINFVLTYPELVSGERTTPRSLVHFFDSIASINDLQEQLPLVKLLADSSLDQATTAAFIAFVHNNLTKLINPEEILNSKSFDKDVRQELETLIKDTSRLDIVATLCTRLINYVSTKVEHPKKEQVENMKNFLKLALPSDLRLSLAQDLMKTPAWKSIAADPQLSKLILQKM